MVADVQVARLARDPVLHGVAAVHHQRDVAYALGKSRMRLAAARTRGSRSESVRRICGTHCFAVSVWTAPRAYRARTRTAAPLVYGKTLDYRDSRLPAAEKLTDRVYGPTLMLEAIKATAGRPEFLIRGRIGIEPMTPLKDFPARVTPGVVRRR